MRKKLILSSLFWILLLPLTWAQRVSDVEAEINKINRQISIRYNLKHTKSRFDRFDTYEVAVYLSSDGGQNFDKDPLDQVYGNVGQGVVAKRGKQIQWRYLAEDPNFDGQNTVFRVVAELDLSARRRRLEGLAGPEGALYSFVFPGWGDYKVRSGKNYWWIGTLSYTLIGSGLYLHYRAKDNYQQYETSVDVQLASDLLRTSRNQDDASRFLVGAGVAVWATDIISVLIRGIRNRKEVKRLRQSRNRFSLHYTPGFGATPRQLGFVYHFNNP